ncbi:electron transport complex protein RnfC [Clostridium tetanomorphum]|uniref:Ion-translocating oxidoreductase complex subunit C n=1 Tax=Clostridium tetanomorphum TaxID=1553 RepID=A0A923IZ11_CLOTT|nr:electron transport complex subunit RsxC [Clostridium tetanomorphum]7ZC6_C Chain C, RnfC [Clostridium tetanomorphum]KAJ52772.1 rnfC/nqrF [Clostridium tetanomorphum DSM 665]MBC2396477.1 electron transport complex subunit RsxC [Clostridium tetanomorphum]MBP1865355.1 electron transport complex protein RnfC [Clostridium tetanomorphum]NRS84878.1 electron transport complex protein RnfC [Clostridium tetanomorphum]NRZ98095.1 electron transport complex protein RnfC [Clostridium tetanomorphum]
MELLTFKNGVHPPHGKHYTENKPIEEYLPKGDIVIPMSQHIGAPAEPIVKKGDRVLVGQKIGEAKGFVSANIHASVSGTVKNVAPVTLFNGVKSTAVIIENDGQYEEIETEKRDYTKLSNEEIINIIKEAGIVGMGGATFPTHVKLAPPPDKNIDSIVVNAAECEPYLTCDHRMMLEKTNEIVEGLKIVLKLFPKATGYIGIEDNKMNAIKAMQEAVKNIANIEVKAVKTKYPQGAEKQLIYAITKREVPSGGLPADAGCIVQNVDTIYEIYNAVVNGKPLTSRVVTVTGDAIKEPKNLRFKIGTSVRELVEAAGGFAEEPLKVISGGPMMGMAMYSLDVPSTKGTSGVLCLTKKVAEIEEESNCINCGKCVQVCPMNLMPTKLATASAVSNLDMFNEFSGRDCIECGCCSFVCPARRHLLQRIRSGKKAVSKKK